MDTRQCFQSSTDISANWHHYTGEWGRGRRLKPSVLTRRETLPASAIPPKCFSSEVHRQSVEADAGSNEPEAALTLNHFSSTCSSATSWTRNSLVFDSRHSRVTLCPSLSGVMAQVPRGVSLWLGADDLVTEFGWRWTDGSPFSFIGWSAGSVKALSVFWFV